MPFERVSPLLQAFSSDMLDVIVSLESMLSSNELLVTVSNPVNDFSDSESARQVNVSGADVEATGFHRLMDTFPIQSTET